ncbi:hypothetical protein SELMODRAFT_420739 [Selaginella moellendorffii]|uniref:Growth-regulating factor n=1 Tax=Selaginella moellendorffii TaxID=88036 RepID=D8SCZ0_SELML|nr:growth-regulating factor 4 [Selaginella moellendorffii]EFJ17791.1 hypothetical protein SELMODRAFT_420739 [Selaginella moellendorffii]|eukprot:XP_002981090.1 growth-regulating factor 4 [Selaginella moellendorffii]
MDLRLNQLYNNSKRSPPPPSSSSPLPLDSYEHHAEAAAASAAAAAAARFYSSDRPPPTSHRMLDQHTGSTFIPMAADYGHFCDTALKQAGAAAGDFHHGHFPFTASQWLELEHQALIFKYMLARAPVPAELIIPIRRAFSLSPNTFQVGLCPSNLMDSEPGRCRRTDGKKWRCAKPVVAVDQKYCERHIHRGRNRSKKSKATLTPTDAQPPQNPSPLPAPVHQHSKVPDFVERPTDKHNEDQRGSCGPRPEQDTDHGHSRKTPEALLRHFFDDWPRASEGREQNPSPHFEEEEPPVVQNTRTSSCFPQPNWHWNMPTKMSILPTL